MGKRKKKENTSERGTDRFEEPRNGALTEGYAAERR